MVEEDVVSDDCLQSTAQYGITMASLRSEKDCQNIDIYREFIYKFNLFSDHCTYSILEENKKKKKMLDLYDFTAKNKQKNTCY